MKTKKKQVKLLFSDFGILIAENSYLGFYSLSSM